MRNRNLRNRDLRNINPRNRDFSYPNPNTIFMQIMRSGRVLDKHQFGAIALFSIAQMSIAQIAFAQLAIAQLVFTLFLNLL